MYFKSRSFIGVGEDFWSNFWESDYLDGKIVGLFYVSGKIEEAEPSLLGKEILAQVVGEVSKEDSLSPFEKLTAIKEEIDKIDLAEGISILVTLMITKDDRICGYSSGSGNIFLIRDNKIANLTLDKEKIIEGRMRNADKILMITDGLEKLIGKEKMMEIVAKDDMDRIEEDFSMNLCAEENQKEMGAVIMEFEGDELPVDETPSESATVEIENIPPTKSICIKTDLKKIFNPIFNRNNNEIIDVRLPVIDRKKNRKINIFIGIIFIILIGIGAIGGYKKSIEKKRENTINELKTKFEESYGKIIELKKTNFDEAEVEGKKAKNYLAEIEKLEKNDSLIKSEKDKLAIILGGIGDKDSLKIEMFYETENIFSDPKYKRIAMDNNGLLIVDSEKGRLDKIKIEGEKSIEKISDAANIKLADDVTAEDGKIYVSSKKGVYGIENNKNELLIDYTKTVGELNNARVKMWHGFLYVLNTENGKIYKYTSSKTGFDEGVEWIKNDEKVLEKPIGIAINGKIWVGNVKGEIVPYLQGKVDSFKTSAIKSETVNNIEVNEDWLIVSDKNMVFVLDKKGALLAKYNLGEREILGISLDDANKELYILCKDKKIYKIKIDII